MNAESPGPRDPRDTINVHEWLALRSANRERATWYVVVLSNMRGGEHTKISVTNRPHEIMSDSSVEGSKEWQVSCIVAIGKSEEEAHSFREKLSGQIRGSVSKAVWAGELADKYNYDIFGTFDTILKVQGADKLLQRVNKPLSCRE